MTQEMTPEQRKEHNINVIERFKKSQDEDITVVEASVLPDILKAALLAGFCAFLTYLSAEVNRVLSGK